MLVQFPLILLSVVTELLQQLVSLVAAHILLRFMCLLLYIKPSAGQ
jgi:hypothetical protein